MVGREDPPADMADPAGRAGSIMEEQRTTPRTRLLWIGLGLWVALLVGFDIALRLPEPTGQAPYSGRQVGYLLAAGVGTVAVVALVAFVRVTTSPPELRRLGLLAVLLPSVFVLSIEVALYFIELDERVTEVGEHVVATAVLAAGAVPFSVYVFRAFARLRDELAQRARRLETLHETSTSVTGALELEHLLDVSARGAREVVGADRAAILLLPEAGRAGVVVAPDSAGGITEADADLMASVAESGAPQAREAGATALLCVPLRPGGRPSGALAVLRDSPAAFGTEARLLLDMFAVAVSAAIDNARRLEEAQLLATVEERERIARDLHDELGQLLGFLTTKIQAAEELVSAGRLDPARRELARLEEATRELSMQVREAILGLRVRVGQGRPLDRALEEYVADFSAQAGLRSSFRADAAAARGLPAPAQFELLRIAQEALTNVRRHSQASEVTVVLEQRDGYVELSVADDGVGFVPAQARSGFGLKTMEERARALGGKLEVRSSPGSGSVVSVRVPQSGGTRP